MSLDKAKILVVCDDAERAAKLVAAVCEAHGDVIYATNSMEALQRLQQFDVAAAVLAWHAGAEATATASQAKKVPFCVFTEPRATAMPLVPALVIT